MDVYCRVTLRTQSHKRYEIDSGKCTRPYEFILLLFLKSRGSRFRKQRLTAVGTCCANHVTPFYPQKLALTSPTGGGRSVGMVRSRTKATEFYYFNTYVSVTMLLMFLTW